MKTNLIQSLITQFNQSLLFFQGRKNGWQLLLSFVCGLCLVWAFGWQHTPAMAQITQARIAEILDGNQVYIQNQPARVNAVAGVGKTVSTKQSRANLLFNNNAGVRLGQNSALTVGSQCVQLRGGRTIVSGTRGCVGSVTAVTRGTVYVMEMDENGQAQIKLLEGEIELSNQQNPDIEPVLLSPGEKIDISSNGILGTILELSQAEVEDILNGNLFEGFEEELPGMDKLREVLKDKFPNISLPSIPLVEPPIIRPPF
ncbi:MAG TPA: hypothetical protein DCY91_27815 [Cyanobacteria bacterium UBA11370]|nr:hypothetical protein [Cyanobacteria bacterium UBA11370]HBY81575.1 hypothetical protein [Cyanobacteria bacterium UBA11148]